MELSVSRSLELLGGLRSVVTDFAKQEGVLVRELKARRYAIDQKHQGVADQTEAGLTKQFEEARTKFDQEEARIRAHHERRRARIERAQLTISRNIPRRARQVRGDWLGALEMKRFRIARQTASDIESAGTGIPGFLPLLETQREKLAALERAARKAFGGCGSLLRMLQRKPRPPAGESAEPARMLADLQQHLATRTRIWTHSPGFRCRGSSIPFRPSSFSSASWRPPSGSPTRWAE